MKSNWSKTWKSSVQPRKQRKYRYNAPVHVRQKFTAVHLDPKLRKKIGKRAISARKGDEVKILRGKKKGLTGKIANVNLSNSTIYIEGQTRESASGNKVLIPFKPSNLLLIDVKLDDKFREKNLKLRPVSETKTEEKKAEKEEVK